MRRTDVIVIGGGQAGLAASFCLTARGIDHAVLERGRIAERWRSATWDSLRLQTPRWQSRLPGWTYRGPDPFGYMSVAELIGYLGRYATAIAAPVFEGVTVRSVTPEAGGYVVATDTGSWRAGAVVIATGYCDVPAIPALAASLPARVLQLAPTEYRRPAALPPGGVLVVGASASGVVLADELRRAGRDVVLAVGRHTRLPRQHRGRDIYDWLDVMGTLRQPASEIRDTNPPSLQLIGDYRTLDLATLAAQGVRLAGRAVEIAGETVTFADDLAASTGTADRRALALVERIDDFASSRSLVPSGPPADIAPVPVTGAPRALHLARSRIGTVIWATGFRRDYRWLRVPGVVERGEIVHAGGITTADGLYVLGLRFQRRRNSNFLDGVGADAHAIVDHLSRRLHGRAAA